MPRDLSRDARRVLDVLPFIEDDGVKLFAHEVFANHAKLAVIQNMQIGGGQHSCEGFEFAGGPNANCERGIKLFRFSAPIVRDGLGADDEGRERSGTGVSPVRTEGILPDIHSGVCFDCARLDRRDARPTGLVP